VAALRRSARWLGIDLDQGRRYSWGYPACPEQSEHEKVDDATRRCSTLVLHHPQAIY
jgi:5-methyltetrahydrofolate--homocysteine methyltransferase